MFNEFLNVISFPYLLIFLFINGLANLGGPDITDNMQFHALISCILRISSLKYNHECMLS